MDVFCLYPHDNFLFFLTELPSLVTLQMDMTKVRELVNNYILLVYHMHKVHDAQGSLKLRYGMLYFFALNCLSNAELSLSILGCKYINSTLY